MTMSFSRQNEITLSILRTEPFLEKKIFLTAYSITQSDDVKGNEKFVFDEQFNSFFYALSEWGGEEINIEAFRELLYQGLVEYSLI